MGERGNLVPGLCGAGVMSGSRLKKKMRENFSQEEKEEAESEREESVSSKGPLLSLFIKQGRHVT
jgi:hypothetical protein